MCDSYYEDRELDRVDLVDDLIHPKRNSADLQTPPLSTLPAWGSSVSRSIARTKRSRSSRSIVHRTLAALRLMRTR
jgi:hypothetical protein